MSDIKHNLLRVRDHISQICSGIQRPLDSVALIAVSKTFPSSALREAFKEGQVLFGENKVQEILIKKEELEDIRYQMHLIGHLQSNKVRKIVDSVEMIHSIDNIELAIKISQICIEQGKIMPILLQVNTSLETQKSGFGDEHSLLQEVIFELLEHRGVHVQGLMTMGPANKDETHTQKCFTNLFSLKEKLNQGGKLSLKHLSMGMSHDYPLAIKEGATLIRVGSSIFGDRTYSPS